MSPEEGFTIHRDVIDDQQILRLRKETDQLQATEGKACIRRLGSKSTMLAKLATNPRLLELLPKPLVPVRSILFDKKPSENWPVAWHQDLTITVTSEHDLEGYGPWSVKDGTVHVQPPIDVLRSMWTLRIHLDDTPPENGALQVIPGSHQSGRLDQQQIHSVKRLPATTCACSPGDVLMMSPLLLHASARSTAPERRRVVHFEYADPAMLHPSLRFQETELQSTAAGARSR